MLRSLGAMLRHVVTVKTHIGAIVKRQRSAPMQYFGFPMLHFIEKVLRKIAPT